MIIFKYRMKKAVPLGLEEWPILYTILDFYSNFIYN